MIACELCGYENIEGNDVCEQCGQPLNESHLRSPKNAVERGLLIDRIDSLNPNTPIVVQSDATIQNVLKLMHDEHIGCVFVVDNGIAIGVFSERDALMRLNEDFDKFRSEPVARFMTRDPEKMTRDDRVAFAIHKMDIGGYRHLPVVDTQGDAVGVISARDILGYLTSRMAAADSSDPVS